MAEPEFHHVPVLPEAVIEGLNIQPGGRYLDATAGGGGHSRLMLEADPTVKVVAVDQDAAAIAATQANLAEFGDRVSLWHGNFADYNPAGNLFDGVLADLGVSSVQLDVGDRGFSFRQTAPLDMRMDPRQDLTAADIVNHWDETELANLIYNYGEERLSRRIARKIVDQRPWQTTTDLAEAISYCVPRSYRYGRIHPATRTFQALRIAVNQELKVLETLLKVAPTWLTPGGRLVIISFHSLEDRLVKHTLKDSPDLKVITKKPVIATETEVSLNPRARSAKLRVAERVIAL
ncbi:MULTISPECIES: 16S rRNA (cytosine(1402)-N(4))-methyltransferase RsmH [Cyanophyceae]|uniref:16S rRNA (cytosine(1402)-N(4))-methyltransferase RsmH n=1 Tax=Cyanophyceae TaxID=3028117 RepID=UPI00168A2F62|nr:MULTISPECIES: 16S rRNA (cytosine(1402)-N(4))-methyltransferase RsmH [Cyanophyceae]MBD1919411.1 16S rRNA (cytosine(1402)-N(4))-methyltransferase RsmH [Phormidium sp. FACHB-77]MBD2035217.1 16S rRNA (cytosine(1402)-N(4))-methyltransferase RsmH [Leptolyngbya sp. FACHB-321]MBD2054341.1 16S rRNA (cytosine(1402)-N(4))-methyltransferase RsmH [Leptolyngbya sp. FACHB-60]